MKYVALLRGINVGGVKLKMAELKEEFIAQGFSQVTTVLATGNVIFESKMVPDLSFLPVKTFVKTDDEIRKVVSENPLKTKENSHIYVFITEPDFAQIALKEFEQLKTSEESAAVANDIFYWQVPIGSTLDTPFGKILGKKVYKERFTSRNINTLERIIKKL